MALIVNSTMYVFFYRFSVRKGIFNKLCLFLLEDDDKNCTCQV